MKQTLRDLRAALADESGETMDTYLELRCGAEVAEEINRLISELMDVEQVTARQARILRILNGEE